MKNKLLIILLLFSGSLLAQTDTIIGKPSQVIFDPRGTWTVTVLRGTQLIDCDMKETTELKRDSIINLLQLQPPKIITLVGIKKEDYYKDCELKK